ncbi:MAG TPA: hypothetical protein PKH39_14635 [Woeseiaceae bacterium]|nr:hypothetical protein [Woeseiaceae bacterium]
MYELLLGSLLVLTIAWLVLRLRRNKAEVEAEKKPKAQVRGAYHAVAIKYSENACDAAKAMTGRRFLSTAAPRLPLPECDYIDCRCQFAHYPDRRTGRDRRSPFAPANPSGATGSFKRERRSRTDRRKPDGEEDLFQ